MKVHVLIDKNEATLLLTSRPNIYNDYYQFDTSDNYTTHKFNINIATLKRGTKFKTNGHRYEIL